MSQHYTVFPIRFSARPQQMIAFFEALGLRRTVDHESSTWAVFRGSSGALAVHGLAEAQTVQGDGHTTLNFATADVDEAVAELTGRGLDAASWDETFGRQGSVTTPDGRLIGLNEESSDELSGGYRVHEQTLAASLDVVAVLESDHFAADAAFLGDFGYVAFGSLDDPWWCDLRSTTRPIGVIGLHRPTEGRAAPSAPPVGPESSGTTHRAPVLVRIGFETSEPLDALAARLLAAGYQAQVLDDEVGSRVVVRDPDGQQLQIHPTT